MSGRDFLGPTALQPVLADGLYPINLAFIERPVGEVDNGQGCVCLVVAWTRAFKFVHPSSRPPATTHTMVQNKMSQLLAYG